MTRLTVITSAGDVALQVCGICGGSNREGFSPVAGVVLNGVASTVVLARLQPNDL